MNRYKVSYRTVINDISAINHFLSSNDFETLYLDNNILYSRNQDLDLIFMDMNYQNYSLSKNERLISEAFILFFNNIRAIKLEDLANMLYVSRSTVLNDIKDLSLKLKSNDIILSVTPGRGVEILDQKLEIKLLFLDMINSYPHLLNIFINSYLQYQSIFGINYDEMHQILINIIGEFENENSINIFEYSRFKLKWYLLLTIFISTKDNDLYINNKLMNNWAHDIAYKVFNDLDIALNKAEIDQLNTFLESLDFVFNISDTNNLIPIQILANDIIEGVSLETGLPFTSDFQLFESLYQHLERNENYAFHHPFNVFYINEDNEYSFLQHSDKIIRNLASSYYNRPISDSELNFINLYFYMSYERLIRDKIRDMNCVVVCNYGVGISELIKAKLIGAFNFRTITSCSIYNLQNYKIETIDIIISTEEIWLKGANIIKVNPNLEDYSIYKIKNKLQKSAHSSLISKGNRNFKNNYLEINNNKLYPNLKFLPSIDYYLNENFINIVSNFDNLEDIINLSSKQLIEAGYITETYKEKVISNIKLESKNIIIGENLILPHAGANDGVIRTAFSLAIITDSNCYYQGEQIYFVCMLAANTKDEHSRALFELSYMFSDRIFRNKLFKVRSEKEAASLIKLYYKK
ncbi:BglG family transcription antiterminator [Anaerococcus urinomassiliensis]|uniref:BglG family transcription antiterminator n=1 Tax=Anaerococcus urinomassiliensis TaxID=1745712 RepID=UPI0009394C12|nr:PTS sugar transporter subunit IIA [Anaerococcus urinomassiliensis]